ncbi:MAG: hypothetical protein KKA65_03425 [Nanoarchaeota archaeon]|nr:hypothetical protein [Nanoarchaeota archaeon]MBU4351973.1 hypothetical protein [Nanoarchaeota archaeon]MBU4456529.1 hypothetical protein [Nanoarchaeota archaeon]MCG2719332.1 hypothetical protein [Nanoarchaeota archaeon]
MKKKLGILLISALGFLGCSEKPINLEGEVIHESTGYIYRIFGTCGPHRDYFIKSSQGDLQIASIEECNINCDPLNKGDKVNVILGDYLNNPNYVFYDEGNLKEIKPRKLLKFEFSEALE